nr:epithelial-stromal interaction protein 1 [Anolis sagrei ordinatus]
MSCPRNGARGCGACDAFSPRGGRLDARDPGAAGQEDWQQQEQQRPEQHSDAYVMIAPNPTKRDQLQKIANKELEDLAKWKEQCRPRVLNLVPQKLGGKTSEAEVRRKQQLEHMQSKYRQKLKREEDERIRREAEEADILKKKAIQREKANKLEEKQRQQEWQRRQMFDEDHFVKNTQFLNRMDLSPSNRRSYQTDYRSLESTSWARHHTHRELQRQEENRKLQEMKEEQRRKAELLELKQKQEEKMRLRKHQNEQQRVNNAFLDRLQSNSQPGGIYHSGCLGNMGFTADSWEYDYFQ